MNADSAFASEVRQHVLQRLVRDLERFVRGHNPFGACFPREQLEDLLALLLLSCPDERRAGPPSVGATALLGALAVRAGARRGMTANELKDAISSYIRRAPPHPLLVEKLVALISEAVASGAIERGSAFAKFAANPRRALGFGMRPKGTISAGPMASFLLSPREAKP